MNVVFLSLWLNFELIQQVALVNFMLFLNILKISKVSFWTFWTKNCISLDLWALFFWKPCKVFRIGQCKQPRLVKPYFIPKTSDTALLGKPLPNVLQISSQCHPEKPFPQHFWTHQQHNSLNVYLLLNFEL